MYGVRLRPYHLSIVSTYAYEFHLIATPACLAAQYYICFSAAATTPSTDSLRIR